MLMKLFGKTKEKAADSPLKLDKVSMQVTPACLLPAISTVLLGKTFEDIQQMATTQDCEIVEVYSTGIELLAKLIRCTSDIVKPGAGAYYSFQAVPRGMIA